MSTTGGDGSSSEEDAGLAPVTYLPGARPAMREPVGWAVPLQNAGGRAATGHGLEPPDHLGAVEDADHPDAVDAAAGGSALQEADGMLARRLRRSALSAREARSFLLQRGIEPSIADTVVDAFENRGWIDDAVLAEQLLHAGTSRKGQGRRAIAQTLSTRGIPRDVADEALAALPDDDADRALEYARSKAHGLRSYDLDTALRRLTGQLARRGYGGSVAAHAARTALTEQRDDGGVRFR